MCRRNSVIWLAGILVVVLVAARPEQTLAAGYWNMPGTHGQRTGHGFGAGYHAPIILGPVRHDGWGLNAPVRLPYAPSPYCGCDYGGGCGLMVETPTSMDGVVRVAPPTTAPTPVAAPIPDQSRSVERNPAVTIAGSAQDMPPVASSTVEPGVQPARPMFEAPVQP